MKIAVKNKFPNLDFENFNLFVNQNFSKKLKRNNQKNDLKCIFVGETKMELQKSLKTSFSHFGSFSSPYPKLQNRTYSTAAEYLLV